MKKLICIGMLVACALIPFSLVAKSVEVTTLKSQKGYEIIKYEVRGAVDLTYVVDPQACVCFITGTYERAVFDCKNLLHHSELAQYVERCK